MSDVPNNEATTPKEKMLGGITGKGFMPGQSGNPSGRPKKTPITDLFAKMLEDGSTLQEIEKAIRSALKSRGKGNRSLDAVKEMADRVEGRATERVEVSGADGGPLELSINLIEPKR